ncbi:MAG TPA: zinc ribbon domain-containing protein [Nitrososphaerales archaeon]|nr:zinc ribbon domain-containing protein [Nitrososphaerales archaeon]
MTSCPNCGNEIREDFSFCPYCETPLKPFCPSCKKELEAGYQRCPYCGFRLGSATPAKRLYGKGGRSRFLSFIITISFVGAVIDIIQGVNESTYQYANFVYQGPIPDLARYLALAQVPIGTVVVLIGVVQFFIFYGLIYGWAFSRRYILKLVSLAFVLTFVMFSLDGTISLVFTLPPTVLPFDVFFVLWAFFVLVVVWRYVDIQETRAILRSTAPS